MIIIALVANTYVVLTMGQTRSNHCNRVTFFFFFFFSLHLQYMEVPRLRVKSELQLPAYSTTTAKLDPSRICHLHHRSRQYQILNPLKDAKDQT